MKNIFLTSAFALTLSVIAQATITCTFVNIQIDSNQSVPLDIDNDGTNDYILLAEYTPYVNNYLVGLNGNEIEVTAGSGANATRARRIESGDPVGALAWNDTAYMIKNGGGSFSGGSEEYGHVGLRLNKSGTYHHAFLELRAPYWQALVAVYAIGYNNEAGAETRTDGCPLLSGELTGDAGLFLTDNQLQAKLSNAPTSGSNLLVFNAAGQLVVSEKLLQQETVIALNDLQNGSYVAVVMQGNEFVVRRKIMLLK